jgi:hypothetical protein
LAFLHKNLGQNAVFADIDDVFTLCGVKNIGLLPKIMLFGHFQHNIMLKQDGFQPKIAYTG